MQKKDEDERNPSKTLLKCNKIIIYLYSKVLLDKKWR
jgi:hypothetical protein